MQVETLVVGDFQVNCYILYGAPGGEAVVIDPGDDPENIIAFLSESRLTVTHIFITHGHGDHIGANGALKGLFPAAKLCIHPRDAHMLTSAAANLSLAFGYDMTSPPADVMLEGNTEITAAGVIFAVEHVPGHTPGSICFVPRVTPHMVFAGDTLFAGSVGRTDFPGGNVGPPLRGIREKLFTLPDDTSRLLGARRADHHRTGKDGEPLRGRGPLTGVSATRSSRRSPWSRRPAASREGWRCRPVLRASPRRACRRRCQRNPSRWSSCTLSHRRSCRSR